MFRALENRTTVVHVGEETMPDHGRCQNILKESQFRQQMVELEDHP